MRQTVSRPGLACFLALALALSFLTLAPRPALAQVSAAAAQSTVVKGVTVKVTPTSVAADAATWVFAVVLDTHSQDLSDDLVANTVLVTDDGRELQPTAWKGPGAGGHHREGTLEFAAPKPAPRAIELKIRRPGESETRSFRWSF
jgi:hypothetical protein